MLAGNPDIDEVIESPEHPSWTEYKKLFRRIFRHYDLAIVTQPSDRAHIYGLLAAPMRVGIVPTSKSHNWWKKRLSLHTVELDYWNQHVVIERLRLLDKFWPKTDQDATLRQPLEVSVIPPSAEPLPQDLIDFVGTGSSVVIHATPMWRFKRWPTEHWADLIHSLVSAGNKVVLTGSTSLQDKTLNSDILASLRQNHPKTLLSQVMDCAGQLTLGQTNSLLSRAYFYIGVDTSITHLAAACGVPTIALFGATAPPNFGPWAKGAEIRAYTRSIWTLRGQEELQDVIRLQALGNVTVVQGPGSCVPCRKAGCDDHFDSRSRCLEDLAPSAVMEVFNRKNLT